MSSPIRPVPAVVSDKRRKLSSKLRKGRPTTFIERVSPKGTCAVKTGSMMSKGVAKFYKARTSASVIKG